MKLKFKVNDCLRCSNFCMQLDAWFQNHACCLALNFIKLQSTEKREKFSFGNGNVKVASLNRRHSQRRRFQFETKILS